MFAHSLWYALQILPHNLLGSPQTNLIFHVFQLGTVLEQYRPQRSQNFLQIVIIYVQLEKLIRRFDRLSFGDVWELGHILMLFNPFGLFCLFENLSWLWLLFNSAISCRHFTINFHLLRLLDLLNEFIVFFGDYFYHAQSLKLLICQTWQTFSTFQLLVSNAYRTG